MKTSNAVVTVIVIAAVLVFAYGLGLLIRHARRAARSRGRLTRRRWTRAVKAKEALEARIRNKEKRAEANEKVKTATPEEKEEFRNQRGQRCDEPARPPGTADDRGPGAAGTDVSSACDPERGRSRAAEAGCQHAAFSGGEDPCRTEYE